MEKVSRRGTHQLPSNRFIRYLAAGFSAGLTLMLIEALDRSILLSKYFHNYREWLSFIGTSSFVPVGTAILGICVAGICVAGVYLTSLLKKPLLERNQRYRWLLPPASALVMTPPLILISRLFPALFANGWQHIIEGLGSRIFKVTPTITLIQIMLYLAIFLALLLLLFIDNNILTRLQANRRWATIGAITLLLFTLAFYYVDSRLHIGRYQYSIHTLAALATILLSFLFGLLLMELYYSPRLLIAAATLILPIAVFSAATLDQNQTVKHLFWRRGVLAKKYIGFCQTLLDRDRDGFSPFFGGGDENDRDRTINKFAREIPRNGNDENGLGGDFQQPLKDYAALNQQPVNATGVKNILFITVDCLRADHLSCYGNARKLSPNIDLFAGRSILFENAYALGTNTGHSFSGIARSNYGSAIFNKEIPTLPEMLVANNLSTASITGPPIKGWLRKDRWQSYKPVMVKGYQSHIHKKGDYWESKQLTEETIKYLQEHSAQPFYIWVHYDDLHAKDERYYPFKRLSSSNRPIDIYDDNLVYTDEHMGRLLKYVETSGLLDSTMIVITADHGEEFGEHGQQFHGGRLYREQTHVPLILWYPGVTPQTVTAPVSTIDLAPTFLRALGITPPVKYVGVDLKAVAAGQTAGRHIFIETPRNIPEGESFEWAVVDGDWRLIHDSVGNTFELYNLKDDPLEQQNLFDHQQERANSLVKTLGQWLDMQSQHENYDYWKTE